MVINDGKGNCPPLVISSRAKESCECQEVPGHQLQASFSILRVLFLLNEVFFSRREGGLVSRALGIAPNLGVLIRNVLILRVDIFQLCVGGGRGQCVKNFCCKMLSNQS